MIVRNVIDNNQSGSLKIMILVFYLILVPVQITDRSTTAEATTLITVKFYFTITMTTLTNMISHN
jgi:hypothetical protein